MTGCRVSPAAVSRFSLSCGGFRSVSTSSRGVEDFIRRVGFVLLGHRRPTILCTGLVSIQMKQTTILIKYRFTISWFLTDWGRGPDGMVKGPRAERFENHWSPASSALASAGSVWRQQMWYLSRSRPCCPCSHWSRHRNNPTKCKRRFHIGIRLIRNPHGRLKMAKGWTPASVCVVWEGSHHHLRSHWCFIWQALNSWLMTRRYVLVGAVSQRTLKATPSRLSSSQSPSRIL